MFERISDHLFLFRDICQVYAVLDGDRALLVDIGSGAALDHVGELGVDRIDWILHTHHHRDQCEGDLRANAAGIPIGVPSHERQYFDDVETFWRSRQVYNMYDVRQTFFSLGQGVRTAMGLEDYTFFEWGRYRFFIQPTPGHTLGHIALVARIDGATVGFTGDLISAPGRIQTLYDLQFSYGAADGVDYLIYSLGKLRRHACDLLCPSHGEPFSGVPAALSELETKLRAYLSHHEPARAAACDARPQRISAHLLFIESCANTFVVTSESGNALFVDYGPQSPAFFSSCSIHFEPGNRLRFLEHSLDVLREEFGVQRIDVAIPTHYHDDHVCGFPYLRRNCGTQIWCHRKMADILEHPHGYKLGCIAPDPIDVGRILEEGETFTWKEHAFSIFHAPGHTDYQIGLFSTIDGRRVLFAGDNISAHDPAYACENVWRNHVRAGSHGIAAALYEQQQAELVCPGHGRPYPMTPKKWRTYRTWCERETLHWRELTSTEPLEAAIYPDAVFLYPYQPPCAPGKDVRMEVWYENQFEQPSTLAWRLVLPDGWMAEPDHGELIVATGKKGIAPFTLFVPSSQPTSMRRLPFMLQAVVDGRPIGQAAEAVVDLRPELDWGIGSRGRRDSAADGHGKARLR